LSKFESGVDPEHYKQFLKASDLIEAARWWEDEGNNVAATRNYAQALEIYESTRGSIPAEELVQYPEFIADLAGLYHTFAIQMDSDELANTSMLHYDTAAMLYENRRQGDRLRIIRQQQVSLLRNRNQDMEAEEYEAFADNSSQDTSEIPVITEGMLKEYGNVNKARSPRSLANTAFNKLVELVQIVKSE
jgi:hypothetical protein